MGLTNYTNGEDEPTGEVEAVTRSEGSMGLSTLLDIHTEIDALSRGQTKVSIILAALDEAGSNPASFSEEDIVLTKAAASPTLTVNADSRPDRGEEKDQDDSRQEDARE